MSTRIYEDSKVKLVNADPHAPTRPLFQEQAFSAQYQYRIVSALQEVAY